MQYDCCTSRVPHVLFACPVFSGVHIRVHQPDFFPTWTQTKHSLRNCQHSGNECIHPFSTFETDFCAIQKQMSMNYMGKGIMFVLVSFSFPSRHRRVRYFPVPWKQHVCEHCRQFLLQLLRGIRVQCSHQRLWRYVLVHFFNKGGYIWEGTNKMFQICWWKPP